MSTGPTELRKWLTRKQLTVKEGAKDIGVSRQTLHKWLSGEKMSRVSARLVEKITGISHRKFDFD